MGATLDESYRHLTRLHRAHDPSGWAATRLLPDVTRHHVHALAGFAVHARALATAAAPPAVGLLADRLDDALQAGWSDDLLLHAVVHTHRAYALDAGTWRTHLDLLRGPLRPVRPGATPPDIGAHLDDARRLASLALPVLEPTDARAAGHVGDLAAAARLTGLLVARTGGAVEPPPRAELGRARRLLVSADLGLGWLPPASARAVRAHRQLLAATLAGLEQLPAGQLGATAVPSRRTRTTILWGGRVQSRRAPRSPGAQPEPHGW